ncbi:MAG: NlpC/P60 family protein [Flavobacteriaceae bacterium]
MKYGLAHLSIVPMRIEKSDASEQISQLLFGELFKIIDPQKKWSKIKLIHDGYEGWVDNKQITEITAETFDQIKSNPVILSGNLLDYVSDENHQLSTIPLGSTLPLFNNNVLEINQRKFRYDGDTITGKQDKENLITTAFMYLNSPYLWGGRTPFGIDCSGFTQMIYRLNGYQISRDAYQQATQGEVLSFIEESEPGDLAFFDNDEGRIIHVGIIMKDNYIIHAHGKVRIDRLDHSGIFNVEENKHTHKLRVIKKII